MTVERSFWRIERFPVVYEQGEAKAVLVDVDSFSRVQLILENLFNREAEPEDDVIAAASEFLRAQLADAFKRGPIGDWERELDEL